MLEEGYTKKDLTNAQANLKVYSLSPEDYAAFRAKQAGYRSGKYTGSKQEARALNLKEYEMKLSPKEQSIFDQVNFVWKTDTSVLLKSDEALQNAILQNEKILNDLNKLT